MKEQEINLTDVSMIFIISAIFSTSTRILSPARTMFSSENVVFINV
jgi:hypothetical protein